MILAKLYNDIYHLIVALFTIYILYLIKNDSKYQIFSEKEKRMGKFLCVFFIIFIGIRPISRVFVDMTQYVGIYEMWVIDSKEYIFKWGRDNIIYDNLMFLLARIRFNPKLFYIIISLIYFGCTYIACVRIFHNNYIIAYIVFLASFSTFSYGTNGIKAGAAAAIFLLALSFWQNIKLFLLLNLISYGIHHSMILPIFAVCLAKYYKNTKSYMKIWCICIIIAAMHITIFQRLLSLLSMEFGDQSATNYLSSSYDWGGRSGFRLDFILYSSVPILIGYDAIIKRKIENELYKFILNIYIITNSIWILCIYIPFTNRLAYLSWFMYPILIVFPYINKEEINKKICTIIICNLAFTLIMNLIYYKFISVN